MNRATFIAMFPMASESTIRLSCCPDRGPSLSIEAEREDELREAVRKEIVARGWAVFCGTTARRTGRTKGECDLTVAADRGRTFYIEVKTRTGKVTTVQAAVHAHLRRLGHAVHVIRSVDQFREAVK